MSLICENSFWTGFSQFCKEGQKNSWCFILSCKNFNRTGFFQKHKLKWKLFANKILCLPFKPKFSKICDSLALRHSFFVTLYLCDTLYSQFFEYVTGGFLWQSGFEILCLCDTRVFLTLDSMIFCLCVTFLFNFSF